MQLDSQIIHLGKNLQNVMSPGLEENEIFFKNGGFTINKSHISEINLVCRAECTTRKIRIKPVIVTDACPDDCVDSRYCGIKLVVERDTRPFTSETYLTIDTHFEYLYDFTKGVNPSITQISAELVNKINSVDPQDSRSIQQPFKASVDPANPEYFFVEGNRCGKFNAFAPVLGAKPIVEIVRKGSEGSLREKEVSQMFPLDMDQIPGNPLIPMEYQGCKNPCVLTIIGCIPADKAVRDGAYSNLVPIGAAGVTFGYRFWIDKDSTFYAQFLSEVESITGKSIKYITPTTLDLKGGVDVLGEIEGANVKFTEGESPINSEYEITFDTVATATIPNMTSKKITGLNGLFVKDQLSPGNWIITVGVKLKKGSEVSVGTVDVPVTITP